MEALRREWKRMPASMTSTLTISAERYASACSAALRRAAVVVFLSTMRWPMYSMMNDRKMPAMTMADVVPSYCSSPRHLLVNMRVACV